ncbi:DUF2850 domain-containing protein [Vibrio sonorensis]|uniref:DUF2850 domain-containing protein n=1 Tax=Vibrio sonorensis TaxID=1004316 RepID=UPI0008DA517D|nr:DUF2850 domain-containing protein [Vibrio sonorensis]
MNNADPAANRANKKKIERFLLVIAVIISIVAVMAFSLLFKYINKLNYPDQMIYGTWVEQNVAPYAADKFTLTRNGVVVNGGVVATQFLFDGKYFKYQSGEQTRRFLFLNQDMTQMRLISEVNYQPIYHLIKSDQQ